MSATTITYDFLQHMTSGDIFAVTFGEGQQVIASVGPIAHRDLTHDAGDFSHNMTSEDNDWFNAGDEFRLLEGAELAQMIGVANEGK